MANDVAKGLKRERSNGQDKFVRAKASGAKDVKGKPSQEETTPKHQQSSVSLKPNRNQVQQSSGAVNVTNQKQTLRSMNSTQALQAGGEKSQSPSHLLTSGSTPAEPRAVAPLTKSKGRL